MIHLTMTNMACSFCRKYGYLVLIHDGNLGESYGLKLTKWTIARKEFPVRAGRSHRQTTLRRELPAYFD